MADKRSTQRTRMLALLRRHGPLTSFGFHRDDWYTARNRISEMIRDGFTFNKGWVDPPKWLVEQRRKEGRRPPRKLRTYQLTGEPGGH